MSNYPSVRHRREYNIVVLGAGGVGKSCLTARFVQDVWIESYDPTIEDSYRKIIPVDGKQVVLEILDTAGTEQFTAMRELYMKQGQGFLLVFSITSANSFAELSQLRESIIRIKDDEDVPIVIVGNKCDMPEDDRIVQRSTAFQLAQSWQKPYYEASAKTRRNVDEVFVDLCRQIIQKDAARHQMYENQFSSGNRGAFSSQQQYQQQINRRQKPKRKRYRDKCEIL